MVKSLEFIPATDWNCDLSESIQNQAINALEEGKVLYFPKLPFTLSDIESGFLSTEHLDPKTKNISFDARTDRLAGSLLRNEKALQLKAMIRRYALTTRRFLERLLPSYTPHLMQAKTSFRPAEIYGRKTSYRKDDTLLHVDAFPSNPTQGKRILRVFTNINPTNKPRIWRTGEPFPKVAHQFLPKVSSPLWGVSTLLQLVGITKNYRTAYDHYMLHIHDAMKGDKQYQQTVSKEEIEFHPGSSWIAYTDQVSHAAISGQHLLEQTFDLPVIGLKSEATAPLKVLEKFLNRTLV